MIRKWIKKEKSSNENPTVSPSPSKQPTTQDWMPVQDVTDQQMIRRDKYNVGGIRIQPININLLSKEEQRRKIRALNDVLNGIDVPYQMLSIARPVDLDAYIFDLEQKKNDEMDFIKKRILEDDIRHAAAMASEGEALDRHFYFLHTYKPEDKNKADQAVLFKRSMDFAAEFTGIGLQSHVCTDQELRDLLFIFTNPVQAAYERPPMEGPYLPTLYRGE